MTKLTFAAAACATAAMMACGSDQQKPTTSDESRAERLTAKGGRVTGKVARHTFLTVDATFEGCTNHPGPTITFTGIVQTDGVDALIIGKNNTKGTHVTDPGVTATASVTIAPTGGPITIQKQPPQGGVGGNPWIYFEPFDAGGSSLGEPVLLGRCVQGVGHAAFDLSWFADLDMTVDTDWCTNSGGPQITLNGTLSSGPGINGKFYFQNQRGNDPAHQAGPYDGVVSFTITPVPDPATFAKQPPLGGAGGNPLMYVQVPANTGPELFLGRCNKL